MSKTSEIVIAKSISHQEFTTVENNRVEFDGFHQSRNVAAAESSTTTKGETYDKMKYSITYHTRDPNHRDGGNQRKE